MYRIDLALDRDQWRTHVNTVMNGFHKMLGSSQMAAQLAVSQERPSFVSK
jgi:hypothetical protein